MIQGKGRRPILKECSNCGHSFFYTGSHGNRNRNFFCCYACYIEYKTKKVRVKCDQCGIEFLKKRSDVQRTDHNYCSPGCSLAYRQKQGETSWNHRVDGVIVHRRIAEEKIGRKLQPGEVVHHIDGNHFNNDPENIAVLSKSEHSQIHASWKERNIHGQFV